MTEQELQILIAAAGALGGLILGWLIAALRGQKAREVLLQEQEQARDELNDSLHASQNEATRLSAQLQQAQERYREKSDDLATASNQLEGISHRYQALQHDYTRLQTQQDEREDRHTEQLALLNEARENLKKDFELLANKIFEAKGESFNTNSKQTIESLLKPFREQITGFQSRVNEVHAESIKGNTALEGEIKKVLEIGLEMNSQATNLATALKGDKKTTGNWGEAQLERTLELAGLLPGDHYETQANYRDTEGKRRLPDFVIKLPDDKSLVIDSKVSLVDYDRAISAETDEEREQALKAHAQAVRNHIDDLSSKDYANLPGMGSPDFVLMFMPIEPAYIEAMKYNKDLFNYGYQKQVVMVSHTTLMPILRTVANLWMIDQSNKEAREISTRAGEVYNQVCVVAKRLQKLGNTLQSANNHYNETVKGLAGKQGLHGKVDRFRQLSSKASNTLVELEPIHTDIEIEKLEAIEVEPAEPEGGDALPEPGNDPEGPTLQ